MCEALGIDPTYVYRIVFMAEAEDVARVRISRLVKDSELNAMVTVTERYRVVPDQ